MRSARTTDDEDGGCCLSPIEEENEYVDSSRRTSSEGSDSELVEYVDEIYEDAIREGTDFIDKGDKGDLIGLDGGKMERKTESVAVTRDGQKGTLQRNLQETAEKPAIEDTRDDDRVERNLWFRDKSKNTVVSSAMESSLDGNTLRSDTIKKIEAAGDNDQLSKLQLKLRRKDSKVTLVSLKNRLENSEMEISTLKKQLALEQSRNRKSILGYCEKYERVNKLVEVEAQVWEENFGEKMKTRMTMWQLDERKRINEETARVCEIYFQEITKTLKSSVREWINDDLNKRINELLREERRQRMTEIQDSKTIYEGIQRHLQNLERENSKSYTSLREQIDAWEERLRNDVVKLHEDDLNALRELVKLWCDEQIENWRRGAPKFHERSEYLRGVRQESRHSNSCGMTEGTSRNLDEDLPRKPRESGYEDLRGSRQSSKAETVIYGQELAKELNDKVSALWTAFEEFKHNFALNYAYERNAEEEFVERMIEDSDENSTESSGLDGDVEDPRTTDFGTNVEAEEDDDEEDSRRSPKKNCKRVSFGKNSDVEVFVPRVRVENPKKK